MIRDGRVVFYIDDKPCKEQAPIFYRRLNDRLLLLKLIPGMDGAVLDFLE